MASVPFENLGPTQIGRMVYQVIGQGGPIPNPSNIRYLPPDYAPSSSGGFSVLSGSGSNAVATALAGVNLLASTGTLALGAATYSTCRAILDQVNRTAIDVQEIKAVLKDVQERVKRIDTRVAESNLREALRHAYKSAMTSEGIDLTELRCLADDLDSFAETLDTPLAFNVSVRLSSDVRKELTALVTFLANLRLLATREYNLNVFGDPHTTVRANCIDEYFALPLDEIITLAFHFGRSDSKFIELQDSLATSVFQEFTFASQEDGSKFGQKAREECHQAIWVDRRNNYTCCEAEALLNATASLALDHWETENRRLLSKFAYAWIAKSDAGLIFRAAKEVCGLRDGYEKVFYSGLLAHSEEEVEETELVYYSEPADKQDEESEE